MATRSGWSLTAASEGGSKINLIRVVAHSLGVGAETLWMWVSRHQPGPGFRPHENPEADNKRLRRDNAERCCAHEILKKASAFFAAELDLPTTI
nr:hypothetical protein [Devriesea agamarum]